MPPTRADSQWQLIKPLFNWQRKRKYDLRRHILNAIFYLLKTGCQWRMLPREFAPWQAVYYYYQLWKQSGLIERLHDRLRRACRIKAGRAVTPSAACIDAQSVKTTRRGGARGFDGGKLVKGRKRHIVVDTMDLLLAVLVHEADKQDEPHAPMLLKRLTGKMTRLQIIFADQGYLGTPPGLVWRVFGWIWQVVRRQAGVRGFVVQKKRWVVERTFAWFESYRRLSKDYEYAVETSEAMIQLAMIRLMINRLA